MGYNPSFASTSFVQREQSEDTFQKTKSRLPLHPSSAHLGRPARLHMVTPACYQSPKPAESPLTSSTTTDTVRGRRLQPAARTMAAHRAGGAHQQDYRRDALRARHGPDLGTFVWTGSGSGSPAAFVLKCVTASTTTSMDNEPHLIVDVSRRSAARTDGCDAQLDE